MYFIIFSLLFSANIFAQTFYEGEYYNFSIHSKLKEKLDKNDNIEFDINNSTQDDKEFYLVFEDNRSKDYWSKLNFKTTLIPGINHLSFNLKRYLGERGSVRYARSINYNKLKKMFIIVNPNKNKKNKYKITNIKYTRNKRMALPVGAMAFSFQKSSLKTKPLNVFKTITEKSSYNKKFGYGFENIDAWQYRDSHTAPYYLSHSISVNKASFKVRLSRGSYRIRLIWDDLGYWDIPFWKKRRLKINNITYEPETRNVTEFLKQLFLFYNEPTINNNIYDYYFKKIFKNYDKSITNKGDFLEFNFQGDNSAVSLNALFIWPKSQNKKMNKFFKNLELYSKDKIEKKYRFIKPIKSKRMALNFSQANIAKPLLPNNICTKQKSIDVIFANNGQKNIDLCINSSDTSPINFSFSDFYFMKNKIDKTAFTIKQYQYEFKSIDLNHETYQLEANRLIDSTHVIKMNQYNTRYISFSFLGGAYPPGKYVGWLILQQGDQSVKKQLTINIINKNYPKLPIQIGVIGLNPFPNTYYKNIKLNYLRDQSALNALDLLQEIGLTLYTDIPAPYVAYKKPIYKSFVLETSKSMVFLNKSKSKNVFFYNGNFPKKYFNDDERNISQTKKEYFANMTKEFQKFQKKSKKQMIYLYSDEATGYRDAVKSDLNLIKFYKKKFPSLLLGGFGNLYDWDKGKELFKSWSFGLYSDIPSQQLYSKVKKSNKEFGVYNLCADSQYDLSFCFGMQLYRLYKANINYYFEWHAAAIHNYPYMDLDGREADIGLFYPTITGDVGVTKRYRQVSDGLEIFKKLHLLENYLKNIKAPGQKVNQAKRWLLNLEKVKLFPIKKYYDQNHRTNSKLKSELDKYIQIFFI